MCITDVLLEYISGITDVLLEYISGITDVLLVYTSGITDVLLVYTSGITDVLLACYNFATKLYTQSTFFVMSNVKRFVITINTSMNMHMI